AYVGPADLHDGQVLGLTRKGETATVIVQPYTGRRFALEFSGVAAVRAVEPEGMMLYALTETTAPPPLRRFVFANWDDEDPRRLEIVAREFREAEHAGPTTDS